MEPEQSARLEHILRNLLVGAAIIEQASLRILYTNPYLLSLLEEPWRTQGVVGHALEEILPNEIRDLALPIFRQVGATGESARFLNVPYEGYLEERGRTYWNASIERTEDILLVTIEDVTNQARSRLYLHAIQHISSAIAGPFALPRVLDRILWAVQEMVGSTRCAVLLIDRSISRLALSVPDLAHQAPTAPSGDPGRIPTVTIAAQKGVHLLSQDWQPKLSDQLLLSRVVRNRHAVTITDTSTTPELDFPLLDDDGVPRRPGSVLCVPIFEPRPNSHAGRSGGESDARGAVLGTIEVYHRRARGFPAEEVQLLEQFAQQVGLAIQNARFFRSINHFARAASRSARQQKNVLQAIPDGVVIYDSRWRIADTNYAMRKLMGWSEGVQGLSVREALARSKASFPPDLPPDELPERERRALERRVDEFKMTGADGRQYTIRRSQAPIHDELGDIFAFVVIYHDVTEQAAARERIEAEVIARTAELAQRNFALRVAKAEQEFESASLQLLLQRLPVGVVLISAEDRRITVINGQAMQILQRLGWKPGYHVWLAQEDERIDTSSIIGMNIEEVFHPITLYGPSGSVVPYEEGPLALALSRGEASEAELHSQQSDGQVLYLWHNAAPLRTSDGTITSVVSVWHDITKLKTLERAREDFFNTMAHELKTPLANIRAHLSALQANDLQWSAEEQHEFLRTADDQVERLVGMINHFLDASRVEAGALRLELEPILLPEMMEDLQDRLEALIASSHRKLEIVLPSHPPAVLGDYELIMSVLTNLLSNAFRYAPEGDVVRLEALPVLADNDTLPVGVKLQVVDRGPGLTEEQQAELFTRFSTFAATRRPAANRPGQPVMERRLGSGRWSPATGLGLYISRGIVEAHGSTLTLKSVPGQGAAFAFVLRVANSRGMAVGEERML